MKVWKMSEEARKIVPVFSNSEGYAEYRGAIDRVWKAIRDETPIEVSDVKRVDYDTKTDRYVITFGSEKPLKMKVTNQVAQFVATNQGQFGSWYIHMIDGEVTDVNLVCP